MDILNSSVVSIVQAFRQVLFQVRLEVLVRLSTLKNKWLQIACCQLKMHIKPLTTEIKLRSSLMVPGKQSVHLEYAVQSFLCSIYMQPRPREPFKDIFGKFHSPDSL